MSLKLDALTLCGLSDEENRTFRYCFAGSICGMQICDVPALVENFSAQVEGFSLAAVDLEHLKSAFPDSWKEVLRRLAEARLQVLLVCDRDGTNSKELEAAYNAGVSEFIRRPVAPQVLRLRTAAMFARWKNLQEMLAAHEQALLLLRTITHDLAGPLQTCRLALGLLSSELEKRGWEDPRVLRLLSRSLTSMVETVRVHRFSGGSSGEEPSWNVHEALCDVTDQLESSIAPKSISVEWDEASLIQVFPLVSRPIFSNQVLANILSNAIKFSDMNGRILVWGEMQTPGRFHLHVQDFGMGMTQKRVDEILSAELNASTLGTAGEEGSGFGFGILRKNVRSFGGDLSIVSIPRADKPAGESGTTVTLEIPVAPSESSEPSLSPRGAE